MKKLVSTLLASCIVLSSGVTAFAERPVKLFVGGKQVVSDVPPQSVDGRTMLPLRAAFEAIGATVDWDNETQTVTAKKGKTEIKLTIGSKVMLVNGVEKALDVAAYIEDGRTMVPVRACSEAFGLLVDWLPGANTVKVRMDVDVEAELDYLDGLKMWNTYDANGNYVEYNDNIGDHSHREYIYDSNDNLIEYKNKYDEWIKYEYDSYGNLITLTTYYGLKITYAYDEQNRVIYIEELNSDTQEITYNDEEEYFVISYSNEKRGKNYKTETRYYKSTENLTTWHVSYPMDYYFDTDENMRSVIESWDRSNAKYTRIQEDNGNTVIDSPYCKYTFDADGLALRCEAKQNGGSVYVEDYIRDVNGKLLQKNNYFIEANGNIISHCIQKFVRITR